MAVSAIDVRHSSLRPRQIEIEIHGRGGQGAKTFGDLLTWSLYQEGMKPHGKPRYTADRMGAPVSYAIRYNPAQLESHDRSWIKDPGFAVLFDITLVEQLDLDKQWRSGIEVLVNCAPDAPLLYRLSKFDWTRVDANAIAWQCGLKKGCVPILSSVMAGAFARAFGQVKLETLETTLRELAHGAVRRHLRANLTAMRRGFEETVHPLGD